MKQPEARASRLKEFVDNPRRAVWALAMPMMVGMLAHSMFVIVDTAFIGWVGDFALAAVTFVFPLLFLLFAVISGIGVAITALVAQAIGRQDHDEADRMASSSLAVTVIASALFVAGGLWTGPWIIGHLGAEGDSFTAACQYFEVLAVSAPLFFIGSTLRSILTGEGDAKTPMIIMTISTVVNIALDALFIMALGMGIRGAALATVLSQCLNLFAFGYVLLVRRRGVVRIRLSLLGLHRPLLAGLVTLGLPTAAGQLVMAAGMALTNRVLAHFGQIAVATYGAASKVDMIVAMPIMGLAGASVTVIGMFAGAGRADLVRSTALYTMRWALIMAVGVGAACFAAAEPIIGIFIDTPEALAMGRTYLGFMIFAYPMMAFGITSGRILQGLGHGLPSLVITSVRVLVVGVPLAYLAVYLYAAPLEAVWAAVVIGGLCANVMALLWIRKLLWKQDPTVRASAGGVAARA